jgi:hypothetical protein
MFKFTPFLVKFTPFLKNLKFSYIYIFIFILFFIFLTPPTPVVHHWFEQRVEQHQWALGIWHLA